jgi:hypothetical protein
MSVIIRNSCYFSCETCGVWKPWRETGGRLVSAVTVSKRVWITYWNRESFVQWSTGKGKG